MSMPISLETGDVNLHHGYAWTYIVSQTKDMYVDSINIILDRYCMNMEYIQILCDSMDEVGRKACEIATPLCLKAIMSRLHFYGRYEIAQPLNISKNSLV